MGAGSADAALGMAKGDAMSDEVRWPRTVDQAVGVLLGLLPEDQKGRIAAMAERDLIMLHFGLGAWIRSHFGLWSGNEALLADTGTRHANDAAMVIIEALWRRLREAVVKVH